MYDMKSVIAVVAVLFAALCCTPVGAKDRACAAVWDSANTAYIGADYEAAIKNYEQLLDSGYESARLYFNLGNAYFKKGMNGRAILNYNKALKLAPGNDDIRYNLSLANAYVQDKIEEVPVFFLKRWLIDLGNRLSGNTWAVLSLVFFALLLIGVGTYLLLRRMMWQKVGFYGAIVSALLFVVSVVYASVDRKAQLNPTEAIVMASAAPVKSSPDEGSKDIFVLHEGTKVRVEGSLGEWREIRIADGNKGWVEVASIEMID